VNYRHGYHAGSFSDVFKHIILISLIQAFKRKEKPFCYFETHAGSGCYDLTSKMAHQTAEYKTGVQKIIDSKMDKTLYPAISLYCELVQNEGYPIQYPGSPMIAETISRSIDRLVLCEWHPEEYLFLKHLFKGNKRVACHERDGYEALKALLPPVEKRGLILIDPSFEQKTEWEDILIALSAGLKKFPTGIYAIWYPIKDLKAVKSFIFSLRKLKESLNLSEALRIEMTVYPEDADFKMMGTGMIVLNPPWQFEAEFEKCLPVLWEMLSVNRAGSFSIEHL